MLAVFRQGVLIYSVVYQILIARANIFISYKPPVSIRTTDLDPQPVLETQVLL